MRASCTHSRRGSRFPRLTFIPRSRVGLQCRLAAKNFPDSLKENLRQEARTSKPQQAGSLVAARCDAASCCPMATPDSGLVAISPRAQRQARMPVICELSDRQMTCGRTRARSRNIGLTVAPCARANPRHPRFRRAQVPLAHHRRVLLPMVGGRGGYGSSRCRRRHVRRLAPDL